MTKNRDEALQRAWDDLPPALQAQPVAWYDSISGFATFQPYKPTWKPSAPGAEWLPLYAAPPAQSQQAVAQEPLTDAQIDALCKGIETTAPENRGRLAILLARAIERAHGITAKPQQQEAE